MNNWKRDDFLATLGAIVVILSFMMSIILVAYLETNW